MTPHSERERERVRESKNQNQGQNLKTENQNLPGKEESKDNKTNLANLEEGRSALRVLAEIAMRTLALLHLSDKPLLLETLTNSIKVKARSKSCTYESAAQQIAARAAFVATESPPDDWVQWFFDARYEYVPQGDKRLKDQRLEARPTCGGSRCSEGWETVKVNGAAVLRRCPDCVRLWRDTGV